MARKKLNKKVVVALSLFCFAAMILLSAVMLRRLQQRDPKYFITLAQKHAADGEWTSAAVLYQKAWQRSNDAIHLVSLGDALLNDGEVGRALASWQNALINQPDLTEAHTRNLEVLLELARLYERAEEWKSVREAADTFLNSSAKRTPDDDAFAHYATGLAIVGLAVEDPESLALGASELAEAVSLAPNNVTYRIELAEHYLEHDRVGDGERILLSLFDEYSGRSEEAASARLALAMHRANTGDRDEAKRLFVDAIDLAREAPETLSAANLAYATFVAQQWAQSVQGGARDAQATAFFDKAESILKSVIEAAPDSYEPYLQLAQLYTADRRHVDVEAICNARLERGLSRKGIRGSKNRFNTFMLLIRASQARVSEVAELDDDTETQERDAALIEAEKYLAEARGELPTHPLVHHQAARIKLARRSYREALNDLRAADDGYRSFSRINWENKLTLARVHVRLDEPGAAKKVLEDVFEQARRTPSIGAAYWPLYARVLFETDSLDRALTIADQLLLSKPNMPEMLRLKAAILNKQGRPEDAQAIVDQIVGDPIVAALLESGRLFLQGDTTAAVVVLRTALKKAPGDKRLVSAAVRGLLSVDRGEEAQQIAREALKANPDDDRIKALAVMTRSDLSAEQRDDAVLKIISEIADAHQRSLEMLTFHWRKQEWSKALEFADEALAHLDARDTPLAKKAGISQRRALLGTKLAAAAALDNDEAMQAARDAAVRDNVDGCDGKSLVGLYHAHREEYELAVNALREAVAAQPTDAHTLTELGRCLRLSGRAAEAEASFQRAIASNPDYGRAHRGLAVLAKQNGDEEELARALAVCERLIPGDAWVQAELLLLREQEDPQAAIARRQQLLSESPDDVVNLMRLARLCEANGDRDSADKYYDRIVELRPDDKAAVTSAGNYYQRTERPDRSLAILKAFAASRPTTEERADAAILVASHYLKIGDAAQVEKTLLDAADVAETLEVTNALAEFCLRFKNKPAEALVWLDKSVKLAREVGSARLPATLALRISCLLDRKLNDVETAAKMIEELLAEFPNDLPGLLLRSEVLSRSGKIDAAIDVLTEYLRRKPNDVQATYQRALHLHAAGRTAEATRDLESLKTAKPLALDLQPRLFLARLYRLAGRADLSLRELESLVNDAPDSDKALAALATAYADAQRWSDAERVVTSEINRRRDNPMSSWFFLRGRIALGAGDQAAALRDLHRGAEVGGFSASDVVVVLDAYARLNRSSDGIEYYRRYAPKEEPHALLTSRYARLLALAGQRRQAVTQFRLAMSLAMDSAGLRDAVTTDLAAAMPPEQAITLFEAGSLPDSEVIVNDRIMARLYQLSRRYDDASKLLESMIASTEQGQRRAGLLLELGNVQQAGGRPKLARKAYEASLEHDGDNWVTLNNLAYLLSDKLGDHETALAYARRSVAVSDSADAFDTLGWIHVGLGNLQEAVAALSTSLKLEPGASLTHLHLGEAYRRSGQFREALGVLGNGRKIALSQGDTAMTKLFETAKDRAEQADAAP